MAFLTSGGSQVTSGNIVDGSILNADVNANAAIAQSKLAGSSNVDGQLISVEAITALPHSLTTDGNTRVLVMVCGKLPVITSPGYSTINLQYNGVTKDTKTLGYSGGNNGQGMGFAMTYTEKPAAATANITITTDDETPTQISGFVLKFKATA